MILSETIKKIKVINKPSFCLNEYKVVVDSRKVDSSSLFLALKGDKSDGHDYIEEALDKAAGVIYERDFPGDRERLYKEKKTLIKVPSSEKALFDLALEHYSYCRKNRLKKVVAITGSNGKTTTKEMLFFLINSLTDKKVQCNYKNFNNRFGLAYTLLDLDQETDILVAEIGTNHPGEIRELAEMCRPNLGVITNIGQSHLEFFKDEAGVFKEKSELYKSIDKNVDESKVFFRNDDDPYLATLEKKDFVTSFGRTNSDFPMKNLDNALEVKLGQKTITLRNQKLMGDHNFTNMGCAFLIAERLFPDQLEELERRASSFSPGLNRSTWTTFQGKEVFLDAYNANPSSMRASFQAFMDKVGPGLKVIAVIGDLKEMGERSSLMHQELGQWFSQYSLEQLVYVGAEAESFKQGYQKEVLVYNDVQKLRGENWSNLLNQGDLFFLKASRSLQLELLIDIN